MTKAIKLSVSYDGYYGGSVNEYCLLPVEWQGVFMNELADGVYDREVYLGEIEGKHSEVYGDLHVETVDLSDLSPNEFKQLIQSSYSGEFECYFEGRENDYLYEVDEEKVEKMQAEFAEKYSVQRESWRIMSVLISDAFANELMKQIAKTSEIYVKAEQFEKAIQLLKDNGIDVLN